MKLTIFTCYQDKEERRLIQQNAINSWLLLEPTPEIILFCDDPDKAETEFPKCRCMSYPEYNKYGTPLISELAWLAAPPAKDEMSCFVNSDIIITQEWHDALGKIDFEKFLAVSKRIDWIKPETINFFDAGWAKKLTEQLDKTGEKRLGVAIDIFAFTKGVYDEIPPFAIGRFAFDNWLVNEPLAKGIPVVDLTPTAHVIHQRHPAGGTKLDDPECQENIALAGMHWATVDQATWKVEGGKLMPNAAAPFREQWYVPKQYTPDDMNKTVMARDGNKYPAYLNVGNAAQFIAHEYNRFCIGNGLDIGCGKWPIQPLHGRAVPADLDRDINDATILPGIPTGSQDFIFSSHCLEHISDWQTCLDKWAQVLKPGGMLFLYLPHQSFKPWNPGGAWVSGHMWKPDYDTVCSALKTKNFEILDGDSGPELYQSFWIAARKII